MKNLWNYNLYLRVTQSDLVRNFLHNLLEKDGFNDCFEGMIDFKIKQKKNELDSLKKHLTEIKQEISELE